jgi:hypothetical protein
MEICFSQRVQLSTAFISEVDISSVFASLFSDLKFSHGKYEEYYLLGCDAVYSGRNSPTIYLFFASC